MILTEKKLIDHLPKEYVQTNPDVQKAHDFLNETLLQVASKLKLDLLECKNLMGLYVDMKTSSDEEMQQKMQKMIAEHLQKDLVKAKLISSGDPDAYREMTALVSRQIIKATMESYAGFMSVVLNDEGLYTDILLNVDVLWSALEDNPRVFDFLIPPDSVNFMIQPEQ